jgi:hypothetical protein
MYDGMRLGLVGRKRVVTIGEQKFGYLKNIVQEAQNGNEEFFEPFAEVLRNYEPDKEEVEEVEDE